MARRKSRVVRALSASLARGYLALMKRLPLPWCRRVGVAIGWLAYLLVPRVRRVALANLDLAYGDSLDSESKRRIAREAARNMGLVAAEFAHAPRVANGAISVAAFGVENLSRDSGSIAIGAHLGNWEWMGPAFAARGMKGGAIVRPFDDPRMEQAIGHIRSQSGLFTIPKDSATGDVIRHLREGALIGILIDQSPRENGVPVTFFGQRTWATAGPALIALRARVPLHLVTMIRGDDGAYTLKFSPAIDTTRTGDLLHDLVAITQRFQDAIETAIREHPGQWLWMHRRFKPRPRLEQEWQARINRLHGSTDQSDEN